MSSGWALVVVVVGVLVAAVDTTIVILALPAMRVDLGVGFASVVWVVLGYLLVITLLATQVGRLGDLFGRVRMYEAGFALFVLGSALCALSWNEASIVAFRLLQGVGGAFISANSGAVIADIFPPEARGRAYGFTSIGWNLGAVLGILAGGLLVSLASWRWIFWINVPIGGGALLVALRVLDPRAEPVRRRLDVVGMAALGAGLFALLWAMVRLTSQPLGAADVLLFAVGLALLAAFTLLQARSQDPVVDLSLFRVPTLAPSFLAALLQALANFSVLFLITMYLQGVRALTPLDAALYLVPGYVVGSVVGPLSGRLADRLTPVVPATVGLAVQILALLLYAHLGVHSPLWHVSAISMVNGVGSGGFFPANNAAVMKAAPRRVYGVASGLLRTFSNVGMIFSFSVALLVAANAVSRPVAFAIFVGRQPLTAVAGADLLSGLRLSFEVSILFLAAAAALSALRARGAAAGGREAASQG
ncbi:MAG: MFS transporter [Firmicutes bacterium]|nr:MFS transporter [Bacillota bacterium]